jgi:predicted AAA+ superfamily ATPase
MTNDELERIMNFLIERHERMTERQENMMNWQAEHQELFASSKQESDERMARIERVAEYQQALMVSVIETQDQMSREIRNLGTHVDRIAEAVALLLERDGGGGANGNGKKA